MQAVNRNPSRAELRSFGLIMLGGLGVVGALLWYRGVSLPGAWWPRGGWGWNGCASHVAAVVVWGVGVGAALTCRLSDGLGRLLYVGWMTPAMYLGAVLTTLLLSVLFVVLLPVFSLIRLKDPLRTKWRSAGSYWEDPTPHEASVDRMRRPF